MLTIALLVIIAVVQPIFLISAGNVVGYNKGTPNNKFEDIHVKNTDTGSLTTQILPASSAIAVLKWHMNWFIILNTIIWLLYLMLINQTVRLKPEQASNAPVTDTQTTSLAQSILQALSMVAWVTHIVYRCWKCRSKFYADAQLHVKESTEVKPSFLALISRLH